EDAVEEERKLEAREHIRNYCQAHPQASFLVRVNAASTSWFRDDLSLCAGHAGITGILLPKAETAAQVRQTSECGKSVLPIVESAKGVLALPELASCPGVDRLSFGSLDLM